MSSQRLTVLFADLAGSTRLFQTEGDVEAHLRVTDSLQCMKMVVENHDGQLLRTVGDAALASFESTDSAYLAAVDIQREHRSLNLSVRVGFHYGEVIPDAGDVYGNAVNLAARIASFAEADEICTSEDAVAQLSIRHRSSTHYLDRVDFKGMSEPMPVYRVHWASDAGETAIITAVSRTERYKTNLVLELLIGAERIRVDERNPSVSFGRSHDNDVVVDSESASRNHAKIELLRGRYVLHDSSTNGTYVIRGGLSPEFIRRESASLDNFGTIGLGFKPDSNSSNVIEFRITSSS
ncbi:MAG: adenylate/guanylate cyclase domain-containing protein [Granulosicoccus sp.]